MKKYMFLFFMLVPSVAKGTSLEDLASCPTGYTMVNEPHLSIGLNLCYNNVGDAPSCLDDNPEPVCFMYAPAGVSYVDSSGTYEYTEPCPLTE